MESSQESTYHVIRATMNDMIREVAITCGEPDELMNLKPSKVNGWQLYHREICDQLVAESEHDENIPPPSLEEMSTISARHWKELSDAERKSWNRKGQALRENQDLGVGASKVNACSKCSKTFKRQRDLRHHEINCGDVSCGQCGKQFPNNVALKRHMKRYLENYSCDVCRKMFSTKQSLERHKVTHAKEVVPCPDCSRMFKSEAIMKRHRKDVH